MPYGALNGSGALLNSNNTLGLIGDLNSGVEVSKGVFVATSTSSEVGVEAGAVAAHPLAAKSIVNSMKNPIGFILIH